MKKIDGVKFLRAEIIFPSLVDFTEYGLGTLTLEHGGRNFIIDTEWSYIFDEGGYSKIEVALDLDIDCDDFIDGQWDLTKEDLTSPELDAMLYIGEDEYEVEPSKMILCVVIDGKYTEINLRVDG